MKEIRFTESQIVGVLKEVKPTILCFPFIVSCQTEASKLVRVKELEAENSQLKRMYAIEN